MRLPRGKSYPQEWYTARGSQAPGHQLSGLQVLLPQSPGSYHRSPTMTVFGFIRPIYARDASNPPKGLSHNSGMVVLGHLEDGLESENLDIGASILVKVTYNPGRGLNKRLQTIPWPRGLT